MKPEEKILNKHLPKKHRKDGFISMYRTDLYIVMNEWSKAVLQSYIISIKTITVNDECITIAREKGCFKNSK